MGILNTPSNRVGLNSVKVLAYTMIIGKVIGTVVTTISHPHFKDRRLLVIQPLTLAGDKVGGRDFIALDSTHAGIGDTVLINREGGGNRQVLNNPDGCVNSVIVGIVDSVFIADTD